MPKFFFHVRGHGDYEIDSEGVDLPDRSAAEREAIAAAKDMVVDAIVGAGIIDQREIEVVSAEGELIAVVPLQSVINI